MATDKEQVDTTTTEPQDETAKEIIDLVQSVSPEPALKRRKLDGNSSVITSVASSIPSESTSNTNSNSNGNGKNRKRKRMEIETIDITQDSSTSNETSTTTSSSNEIDINTNKKKKKKSKSQRKNKDDIFSSYAIKKIIKGDQTLCDFQVSAEAVNIIGKVTQHFMDELLKGSISNSTNKELEYDNIADYIDSSDKFSFLSDIVPPRLTFKKACNKIRKAVNPLPISIANSNNDNKQKQGKEEMDQDEKK